MRVSKRNINNQPLPHNFCERLQSSLKALKTLIKIWWQISLLSKPLFFWRGIKDVIFLIEGVCAFGAVVKNEVAPGVKFFFLTQIPRLVLIWKFYERLLLFIWHVFPDWWCFFSNSGCWSMLWKFFLNFRNKFNVKEHVARLVPLWK